MTTQALYPVTVQAQIPALQGMSLEELETQKRLWIKEGLERFDDFATVIREFGHYTDVHSRKFHRYEDTDLMAIYSFAEGTYLIGKQTYSITQTVAVWIGPKFDTQVCSLKRTSDPGETHIHDVYIPGRWEGRLLKLLPDALEIVRKRDAAEREQQRLALLRQLLVGKAV